MNLKKDEYRDARPAGGQISVLRPLKLLPTPVWSKGIEKLMIGSLDELEKGVEAQFNPRELAIEQPVPWQQHKHRADDTPWLEFTGGENRTMSLELMFDGYETGQSVEPMVLQLANLGRIRDPASKKEEMKRPHQVVVVFGTAGLRPFKGVIESLSTKYTMFLRDGTPVRATCHVKIKETDLRHQRRGGR